jgi:hypothetical protein
MLQCRQTFNLHKFFHILLLQFRFKICSLMQRTFFAGPGGT